MRHVIFYPFLFLGGWLFNFIVDIQFITGFAAGWLSHSAFAPYFEQLKRWLEEAVKMFG
jgi:hypothetical protein